MSTLENPCNARGSEEAGLQESDSPLKRRREIGRESVSGVGSIWTIHNGWPESRGNQERDDVGALKGTKIRETHVLDGVSTRGTSTRPHASLVLAPKVLGPSPDADAFNDEGFYGCDMPTRSARVYERNVFFTSGASSQLATDQKRKNRRVTAVTSMALLIGVAFMLLAAVAPPTPLLWTAGHGTSLFVHRKLLRLIGVLTMILVLAGCVGFFACFDFTFSIGKSRSRHRCDTQSRSQMR